jgi:hypothetical protein
MKAKLSRLLLSLVCISVILSPQGTRGQKLKDAIHINFGGVAYVDADGNQWEADTVMGISAGRFQTDKKSRLPPMMRCINQSSGTILRQNR